MPLTLFPTTTDAAPLLGPGSWSPPATKVEPCPQGKAFTCRHDRDLPPPVRPAHVTPNAPQRKEK